MSNINPRWYLLAFMMAYMMVGTMEYNDCINYGVCP